MAMATLRQLSDEWCALAGGRPARWPPRALVIGDTSRPELSDALAALRGMTDIAHAASIDDAERLAARHDAPPDLVVLLPARPGEFAQEQIERLQASAPLARFVAIVGTWDEGQGRSGRPWPGVPRVANHQAGDWLSRVLRAWGAGRAGELSLPATATEEERLLAGELANAASVAAARSGASGDDARTDPLPDVANGTPRQGTIVIHASWPPMAAVLHDGCRSLGYRGLPLDGLAEDESPRPTGAILDVPGDAQDLEQALCAMQSRLPGVPIVVLANFPRFEQFERARQRGACAVLSKPVRLTELADALARGASPPLGDEA